MKFLVLVLIIAGYALASPAHAVDPCNEDPACSKVDNAHFDNPYHYIFVGAYPADELLIYPLLKDHCSLTNSYCAMIIPTRGNQGVNLVRATPVEMSAQRNC